jgi:hypothetical protein
MHLSSGFFRAYGQNGPTLERRRLTRNGPIRPRGFLADLPSSHLALMAALLFGDSTRPDGSTSQAPSASHPGQGARSIGREVRSLSSSSTAGGYRRRPVHAGGTMIIYALTLPEDVVSTCLLRKSRRLGGEGSRGGDRTTWSRRRRPPRPKS